MDLAGGRPKSGLPDVAAPSAATKATAAWPVFFCARSGRKRRKPDKRPQPCAHAFRGKRTVFHRPRRPTSDELNRLLDRLSRRIVRVLARHGLLIADPEHPSVDWVPDSDLDRLQAASMSYRIAIGPQAGRKALTLYSVPPVEEAPNNPLLARRLGFSLHGATVCEAWQRSRLERLCRYITRPPTR